MRRIRYLAVLIPLANIADPALAHAKSCNGLNGLSLNRGELYARYLVRNDRTGKPEFRVQFLYPGIAQATTIDFDEKIRLIYVVDPPGQISQRNYAGTLAVRLVSTPANGAQQSRQPSEVMLERDSVQTYGQRRRQWSGSVEALRYYNFHRPSAFLASDSELEQTFHTTYTYRRGEERSTVGSRDRRSAFHFPEMRGVAPQDKYRAFVARWLGSGALAAGTESRFQSHIKYYPASRKGHCVTVQPYLEATDNGALRVTIADLDDPEGIRASSKTWNIRFTVPNHISTR